MILRFHADDFTGASDVILQCRKNGMNAAIVDDLENVEPDSFDGLASTVRSMTVPQLEEYLPPVLELYKEQNPQVFLYKVCSTFDSSAKIGSIGRAIQLVREHLTPGVPVVVLPAQPGFGRWTAFRNHFAASGDKVYRLDRHPVMSCHPSTPMSESDLQLILADQGIPAERIASVNFLQLRESSSALENLLTNGEAYDAVVVDGLCEADLDQAAKAMVDASQKLGQTVAVIGSGGIAGALSRVTTSGTELPDRKFEAGPVLALSGSRSPVTEEQLKYAADDGWLMVGVDAEAVVEDSDAVERACEDLNAFEALKQGRSVVVSLAASPDGTSVDPAKLAQQSGRAYADLMLRAVKEVPTCRLMILGGDTSSWTISNLAPERIQVASQFVQAGPIVTFTGTGLSENTPIVLKGGQVGGPDTLVKFKNF